ncbi:MAG: hypothetical protein HY294_04000 [Candidatus Rokubacteria bacterium]|nr:hypothetical protein [Candidatus Rokubacteria bacterium]MBI3825139.1 hypothetical protein [Candidatus Rokubacteria bacterium]
MTGFDWSDFLLLARDIVARSSSPSEAACRTAASRAYYAAFHVIRETVETRTGQQLGQVNVHRELLRCLREQLARDDLAVLLERLLRRRGHADYNGERPFAVGTAVAALELADRALAEARAWSRDR